MTSLEASRWFSDGSLDFVYIDGNHALHYVLEDLEAWTPKVRRGGIVAGHDCVINPKLPFIEVEQAVRAFTAGRGIAPWFILAGDPAPSFFWMVP
jgi:predicted O-methyltransferase YrrM